MVQLQTNTCSSHYCKQGNAFSLNPCRLWSHSHVANAITLALLATAIDVKKKRTDNLKSEASNQRHFPFSLISNLHCLWFLKSPKLLNVEHQITAIHKLHHKIETILKRTQICYPCRIATYEPLYTAAIPENFYLAVATFSNNPLQLTL